MHGLPEESGAVRILHEVDGWFEGDDVISHLFEIVHFPAASGCAHKDANRGCGQVPLKPGFLPIADATKSVSPTLVIRGNGEAAKGTVIKEPQGEASNEVAGTGCESLQSGLGSQQGFHHPDFR